MKALSASGTRGLMKLFIATHRHDDGSVLRRSPPLGWQRRVREYAYDRKSSMGKLHKGLTETAQKKWIVVDMKEDWKTIFPAADTP